MASRAELKEQKEKTSNALIQAAIQLCAEEGYASLSLRSVARKAGIAPTSFYRHFRDIDELGVAIVARAKTVLNQWQGQAQSEMKKNLASKTSPTRHGHHSIENIVRIFVESFITCLTDNKDLLHLFFQEETGSSEPMRKSISAGINTMAEFLSEDLVSLGKEIGYEFGEVKLTAISMITIVSHDSIALPLNQKIETQKIIEILIKKLILLLLGGIQLEKIKQGHIDE